MGCGNFQAGRKANCGYASKQIVVEALGLGVLLLMCLATGWGPRLLFADSKPSKNDSLAASDKFEKVVKELSNLDSKAVTNWKPIVVSAFEVNSYLKYHGREFLPAGVYDPRIQISGKEISGTADVDFNKLNITSQKNGSTGVANLLGMLLKGRQQLFVKSRLESANGSGKLTIQTVSLDGTAIPDWMINYLLDNYLKKQCKIDLSKPWPLPDHLTRIALTPGQAVLYRSPSKKPLHGSPGTSR